MAEFPALPLWTDAYMADTTHLSYAEHGLYMAVLMHMWRTPECRLPNDDRWLKRKFRLNSADLDSLLIPLLKEFCQCDGNWWTQKKLLKVFCTAAQQRKKQRDRAKARWEKEKRDAAAMQAVQCSPSPSLLKEDSSLRSESCATLPPCTSAADIETEFDSHFWPTYPNRKGKKPALAKFRTARKRYPLAVIMTGLDRYIREKPSDRDWLMPATFLHQERFNDEPEPARRLEANGRGNGRSGGNRSWTEAARRVSEAYERTAAVSDTAGPHEAQAAGWDGEEGG